jgi:hypothetical protein
VTAAHVCERERERGRERESGKDSEYRDSEDDDGVTQLDHGQVDPQATILETFKRYFPVKPLQTSLRN